MKNINKYLLAVTLALCSLFVTTTSFADRAPVGRHDDRQTQYEGRKSIEKRRTSWNFSLGLGLIAPVPGPVIIGESYYCPPPPVYRAPVGRRIIYPYYEPEIVTIVPVSPPPPRVVYVPTPVPAPAPTYYSSEIPCQYITAVYDNGDMIELSDGTLWQVEPQYLQLTRRWLRNEQVQVTRSQNPRFPFIISNKNTRNSILVSLKGPNIAAQDPIKIKSDTSKVTLGIISQSLAEGEIIRLSDNSLWEISPSGKYTARLWRQGEIVAIGRSGQYTYPHLLTHQDTGEVIEARQKASS